MAWHVTSPDLTLGKDVGDDHSNLDADANECIILNNDYVLVATFCTVEALKKYISNYIFCCNVTQM